MSRTALRFVATGLGATAVHALVALLLLRLAGVSYAGANLVASLTATLFSYLVNTLWSFEQRVSASNAWRFCTVALLGAGLAGVVAGTCESLGRGPAAAIVAVVAAVTPLTYLLHRSWTFAPARR
jgi:putative flippase GtrA